MQLDPQHSLDIQTTTPFLTCVTYCYTYTNIMQITLVATIIKIVGLKYPSQNHFKIKVILWRNKHPVPIIHLSVSCDTKRNIHLRIRIFRQSQLRLKLFRVTRASQSARIRFLGRRKKIICTIHLATF